MVVVEDKDYEEGNKSPTEKEIDQGEKRNSQKNLCVELCNHGYLTMAIKLVDFTHVDFLERA